MERSHILLVEDEPSLARVIKESLERSYTVFLAEDGRKAFPLFQNNMISLCVIDVMLPHIDGFTLARQIRAVDANVPVLFLTARIATQDVIEGYESGGNDYLKKPFSLEELFLRVHELLRRNSDRVQGADMVLSIGNYVFIPHKQTIKHKAEEEVKLSYRETQLLKMLYESRNNLLDRKKILLTLWGDDNYFNGRTMDVFITKLRKHLKQDTAVEILNMRGAGYKLIC
jgi:two-component system, OmpR family, response regulator TrcR